ncbi:MAG: hypothetical protein R2827_07280 [Bdellovibrionales bacterium]
MRAPLKAAGAVQPIKELIREVVPFAQEDRVFKRDIEAIKLMIRDDRLLNKVHTLVGELE